MSDISTEEALRAQENLLALAPLIRGEFGERSFYRYCLLVSDKQPPRHAREEWFPRLFDNRKTETPTMLWAARGMTKSTTAVLVTTYCLGHFPAGSCLIICADDAAAGDFARAVMTIVDNPKWRLIFPNVEPDKNRAWGVQALWVKRTDMPYEMWVQETPDALNPSVRCVGYKSRVRGAHPATLVVIDDIHNDENAFSDRELARVKTFVGAELQHTLQPNYPWEIVIGTPFHEDDAYSTLVSTGKYDHIVTPAARNEFGDPAWPGEPVWPEGLPADKIQLKLELDETAGVVFRREVLCDIKTIEGREMPYTDFKQSEIESKWPTWAGVDFATIPDPGARMKHRSHAAIGWIKKTYNGQLVLEGGEIGQWTQGQTIDKMKATQNRFQNFQYMGFDVGGKGEIFYENFVADNPDVDIVPWVPSSTKKAQRYFDELGPRLRRGDVMISDDDTSVFLRLVRTFLNNYPRVPHQSAKGWDAMDAFYIAYKAAQGELHRKKKGKKPVSPFKFFGAKYDVN